MYMSVYEEIQHEFSRGSSQAIKSLVRSKRYRNGRSNPKACGNILGGTKEEKEKIIRKEQGCKA